MRSIHHRRLSLLRWTFLVAALALAAGTGTAQRFPPDPVEDLRQALKASIRDPMKNPEELEFRQKNLTKRIEALQTIGELRRALQLQEWRDEDRDEKVAKIDQPLRTRVAERFEGAVRDTIKSGGSLGQLAVANLLGEMGITVRGTGANKGGAARPLTPDLVGLLTVKNPAVREAAARTLGRINPDPDVAVPALDKLFNSERVEERRAAAAGLVNLMQNTAQIARGRAVTGIEASREELVKAAQLVVPIAGRSLSDKDAEVRRLAAEAIQLSAIALGDLVFDPRSRQEFPPDGRKWTAEEKTEVDDYRKQVDDERAGLIPLAVALKGQANAVTRALHDPTFEVRLMARRALEEVGNAHARLARRAASVPVQSDAKEEKEEEQQDKPKRDEPLLDMVKVTLPALDAGINDPDVRIRLATLNVLELLGDDAGPALGTLLKALSDPDRFVRWSAVRVLAKTAPARPETVVPALTRLLADEDLDLRVAVAATLERYGPAAKAALPALMRAITTGDTEIRVAALRAIVSMGTTAKPAIPAEIAALDDPEPRVRKAAADALGKFGPAARDAEPALRRSLGDLDPEVRRAASDALLSVLSKPEK